MNAIYDLSTLHPNHTPSLACICPYNAHVALTKKAFKILCQQSQNIKFDVEFDSVDGFQGREKDYVVLVVPNTDSEGFLLIRGRANSSFTRLRYGGIVVADTMALERMPHAQRNPFFAYVERCKQNRGRVAIDTTKLPKYDLEVESTVEAAESDG